MKMALQNPQSIEQITKLLMNENEELPDGACFLIKLPVDMKS